MQHGAAGPAVRGRADVHMHTTASDGLGTPEDVVRSIECSGLDLVAITDHDTLEGAFEVREIVARGHFTFEVIVGCEVTTVRGVHLLALYIEAPLPSGRSLEQTIDLVQRQGGLCIAPHPLSPLTPSVGRGQMERLLAGGAPLAAVETLNPSPAGRVTRAKLARLNRTWKLAETGSSDAHFPCRIGTAYTEFDGRTAADFRRSLETHTTVACELPLPHPAIPLGDYVRQCRRSLIVYPVQKLGRRLQQRSAAGV